MTFVVAITGSIACGKSTVLDFFALKDIQIISADEINRSLLEPKTPAYNAIIDHFGISVLDSNNQLNKKLLRHIIFSNVEEKHWLESLLHPLIRIKIEQQVKLSSGLYVVVEIPLLQSRHDYPYINRVLLIDSNKETQIKRLIQRDHCSAEQAETMIGNHPPLSEKRKLADDIIENNSTKEALYAHLEQLHNLYLKLAQTK